MNDKAAICALCGEPMPEGEKMFKYHGYSGGCPKPPLPKQAALTAQQFYSEVWLKNNADDPRGDWPIRFAEAYHLHLSEEKLAGSAVAPGTSEEKS